MVKFSTYTVLSVLSVLGTVCYAVGTRHQFYLVMFYLAHSKISLALWVNMGLVLMCVSWQLMSTLFLGPLREAEVERLNELFWKEVMEILFAMTVFRDELHLRFIFWISVLLFFKMYHWLVQKRVEYIETTPSMERLSHVRLCTFMALLLMLDCLFFHRSFSHLLKTRQPSVSLFFAFE